jgi:hypothetical protein
MDSILTLAKTEGMLFKFGSGTGHELLDHSQLARVAKWRWRRFRPGVVYEGL